jgi:hypothetical protein
VKVTGAIGLEVVRSSSAFIQTTYFFHSRHWSPFNRLRRNDLGLLLSGSSFAVGINGFLMGSLNNTLRFLHFSSANGDHYRSSHRLHLQFSVLIARLTGSLLRIIIYLRTKLFVSEIRPCAMTPEPARQSSRTPTFH